MSYQHFNELQPDELERLAILNEECVEVCQVISKIIRHGYESCNPFDETHTTNRQLLEQELGDLQYAISMLVGRMDVSETWIETFKKDKAKNIQRYLHHNAQVEAK